MATQIKSKFKTVDEYISSFPEDVRRLLEAIRRTIRRAAPEAEEIISYNMPAYKLDGFLVSFAAWKNHIGLYPIPTGDEVFKKEIAIYKDAKSTVQIPYDKPLPLKLIARLVKFRVKENNDHANLKKKK
jgi:uncharacterized protein YdhG (YjbR/CyaY superfamily)